MMHSPDREKPLVFGCSDADQYCISVMKALLFNSSSSAVQNFYHLELIILDVQILVGP